MSKKVGGMVAPELFNAIANEDIRADQSILNYLEVRNDVIKGLSKLKRGRKMDVYDACVGGKGMPVPEFLIAFEYKGMNVVLKGLIASNKEDASA
jgi:hypothetical protein